MSAIGFIGAGKCGMSLAYYFGSKGVNVVGFSSRSNNTEDFEALSCEELVRASDIIFITVTDTAIPEVWNKIRHMDLTDKVICHCSGSVSSEIFKEANPETVCSVHPMMAFNSRHTSISAISEAFFTIEGGKTAVDRLSEILSLCGNGFKVITSENKAKYHAAACFASNFVVSVCRKAFELLNECGFSEEEARAALEPLMRENMENIITVGCKNAVTGPAARGDAVTIDRHMKVLDEKTRELYRELTEVILDMEDKNEKHNLNL
ncbi:MAG: DUF2520 domain-containing protein [Firmicutes bacterium]|nr:DUF2520 domain-containing protein [Bacillota bacterium]